ncbi:MAG: hypothetical protein KDH15_09605 [Rhodocyclaceae bacterium]|nr:hypothetical protein [Rhodocyclaceae bacterium]
MDPEQLKVLEKDVRRLKRIAAERASELHDLVEDRLPAAYHEIPEIAAATFDACKAWAEARDRLEAVSAA